jgi:hypothetical protein
MDLGNNMENESNILTVDAITNESIIRAATTNEVEYFNEILNQQIIEQAKTEARLSALAKLADLGLTAEEIAAL